jgi:carboxyl-terminal processing protease
VSPIAGYPAEKAGLKPKDVISKINGEQTHDLTITEAVNKIRGEKGTKVKLTIVRDGAQELDFEIERAEITIPSVTSEILDGNIGYIKISRFGEDTGRFSRAAAKKFKDAGVAGVVLDVRGNPGGLVTAAVDVSSLWLPSGKVVMREKRGDTVFQTLRASGDAPLQGIPTVALIDEGSASASEITAGALKDNGAASLIGQKSFGKGSMQQLEDLVGGGLLKVTIARWYTPNDKNIDKEGIQPDTKVERTDEDFANNRDPQKDAALQMLRK